MKGFKKHTGTKGKKHAKTPQNASKVAQKSPTFLSLAEAAKRLGIPRKTARRWCISGRLQAQATDYGEKTTYKVYRDSVELMLLQAMDIPASSGKRSKPKPKNSKAHTHYITGWQNAMRNGLMTGKPFSPYTVEYYSYYVDLFFKTYTE